MPQLSKGGKFVYGWSVIRENGTIRIPEQVLEEYKLLSEDKVIGFSGSKTSGALCISSKNLIENSILKNILIDLLDLNEFKCDEGELLKYKGRYYFWLKITDEGMIKISKKLLDSLELQFGDKLLMIRGSNIAFDFVIKGPLYKM